jgi:hypothetical protein
MQTYTVGILPSIGQTKSNSSQCQCSGTHLGEARLYRGIGLLSAGGEEGYWMV